MQGRVREMALMGCRPSTALTALSLLAASRENASENASAKYSRNVRETPSDKPRQQAGNNLQAVGVSTPAQLAQDSPGRGKRIECSAPLEVQREPGTRQAPPGDS